MDKSRKKHEQAEVEERSSPSGAIVYQAVLAEGIDELRRPSSALFWSGIAAGLSMGASLVAEGLLASCLPDAPWKPLITKFGYCVGFLIVILGRQQLFTENTLTPMLPLLREKTWKRFVDVMRLWSIVLGANLLGCLAVAWGASAHTAFSPEVQAQFSDIGRQAMMGSFGAHLVRAIFAGWMIALMVWMLPFAETARVEVIIIVSYFVGLGHLSHVVAGAVQVFYVTVTGQISWWQALAGFLAPTFLGNIIGGVTLVAALNHAQVVSGRGGGNIKQKPD